MRLRDVYTLAEDDDVLRLPPNFKYVPGIPLSLVQQMRRHQRRG